jgi:hypothetical protein
LLFDEHTIWNPDDPNIYWPKGKARSAEGDTFLEPYMRTAGNVSFLFSMKSRAPL